MLYFGFVVTTAAIYLMVLKDHFWVSADHICCQMLNIDRLGAGQVLQTVKLLDANFQGL